MASSENKVNGYAMDSYNTHRQRYVESDTPENLKKAIKKIESDYFNPRINNMDKLYSELPTKNKIDNTCEYTQDKDTLDNVKLSDRLDPNMLDPFRENPYTQSLASFAY